ncbi:MAG: type IV secretion system protein [Terriglobia bacterium]
MGTLTQIFNFISQLLSQHGGQFAYIGQSMYTGLATIMVVWFGIKSAFGASEVVGGFHFGRFAELLLMIAFGYAMVNYYTSPIPGFGMSFPQLVTNESQYLTSLIGTTALQTAQHTLNTYRGDIPHPGITDITGSIEYIIIVGIMAVWKFIAIAVNLFGPVATAVAVLIGPIFIPFFIVPKLEWLFWGWLKFFIAYAFYQVIAAAVTYVLCNLVVALLMAPPFYPIPLDPADLIGMLAILLLGGAYILLKVPAMTNHLFSGSSGISPAGDIYRGITGFMG